MSDAVEKMLAVMNDVRELAKLSKNAQFNFMFRGVDAVMNAVGPALRTHGLVVQSETKDLRIDSYTTTKNTVMNRAIVEVRYIFTAADESVVTAEAFGEASDTMDKSVPKAMSVAYRTAILQMLCLPTHEADPDETNQPGDERAAQQPPSPLVQALSYLKSVVRGLEIEEDAVPDAFLAKYGKPINAATVDEVRSYIDHVQETRGL